MIQILCENWGTIVVCLIVLAVVFLCVRSMIRNKRLGKSGCGGSCGGCSGCGCGSQIKKADKTE